jgi:hypothetical protein
MSGRERRISPRKDYAAPLRFRIISNGYNSELSQNIAGGEPVRRSPYTGTFEGQSVNLSERGIYFTSREKMSIGQPIEMYFTIPRELTGRMSEQVRCRARVVHVEDRADQHGMLGVGAAVDRFEPVASRDWGN